MRILISNDDGYFAPGIERLAAALAGKADITVVAPERDRSGASNSLTLDRPLTVLRAHNGFYYVNGTPTDCVHLAVTGLLDHLPDIVISGINLGANMGDDTIYSGTVAAATEGYLLGIPAIAISLTSKAGAHYETAAGVRCSWSGAFAHAGRRVAAQRERARHSVRRAEGSEVTRLGKRHKAEPVVRRSARAAKPSTGSARRARRLTTAPGTDFGAVAAGTVSVTPLQIDLTHYDGQVARRGLDRRLSDRAVIR